MTNKEADKTPKKQGRPPSKNSKHQKLNIRFNDEEIKAMDKYIKKHKFESRTALIREAIKEKINQLDIFKDT
tara:strand:- start:131 stop:346 length:216 start_codon:yes stop_codon:yes gene_type:complete